VPPETGHLGASCGFDGSCRDEGVGDLGGSDAAARPGRPRARHQGTTLEFHHEASDLEENLEPSSQTHQEITPSP
jgi:hypothetical protein